MTQPLAIALHGGSGTILPASITPEQESLYRAALHDALAAGWRVLTAGGSALDAVQATVLLLEDCPLFNAGRGAVFTHEERHELDAAVMCGKTRKAGAVAGVQRVRNPVILARSVMDHSGFVFLAGCGAEQFAKEQGLEMVSPDWFATDERYRQLLQAKGKSSVVMDHDAAEQKFGTVGAVALDADGNLAAATSTGGLTNKRYGRVGDTPVIGSGTYADNATCAVSCTGYGEEFIRAVVAHDVAARMRYLGESLSQATTTVIHRSLPPIGGSGGLIACDRQGNVALPFNTEGMYRAWQTSTESARVEIFSDNSIDMA